MVISISQPKKQSRKFSQKFFEKRQYWKSQFFWVGHLDFFLNLWKSVKVSCVARMGQNFVDYPSFQWHHNPVLIRNRFWILTRISGKKPLEKTFLFFKKLVKSIQTAGYNGAGTVYCFSNIILNGNHSSWNYEQWNCYRNCCPGPSNIPRPQIKPHQNSWQYTLITYLGQY